MLHALYAFIVALLVILPLPLLGRRIEARRHAAGQRAVALARAAVAEHRRRAPALPPARAITPEEELEQKLATVDRDRNRRTGRVLDRLETRWHSELDRVLERAFDALQLDALDREWAVLGTGERVLLPA